MHSESKRSFCWAFGIYVLDVLFVTLLWWASEGNVLSLNEWEKLSLVQKLIVHDGIEISCAEDSIPVINDMSTVHDLSKEILEIIPWHFA